MSNFLLIGGRFDLDVGANSICIRNIAFELKKRGHKVFLITNSWDFDSYHEFEELKIWGIKQSFFESLEKFQRKIPFIGSLLFRIASYVRRILLLPFYPNVSAIRSFRITTLAKKIICQKQIDVVISFYRPIEALYSSVKLKQHFEKKIKVFNYHLDLLYSDPNASFSFFLRNRIKSFVKKEFNMVDYIILPETEKKKIVDDKIIYSGFPVCLLKNNEVDFNVNFSKDNINCVYIGSFDCNNRNPFYILKLIKLFNEKSTRKLLLHIWGFVDNEIKKMFSEYDFIHYNGFLESSYSLSVLKQSDFILNVGNKNTYSMLPSKIFTSFLSGKPIINIIRSKKDISIKYFEEYAHSLNIFEEDLRKEDHYKQLIDFVFANKGKIFDIPQNLIESNTPEYIINIIEKKGHN